MKQTEVKSTLKELAFSIDTDTSSLSIDVAQHGWSTGTCPVCGYEKADIDPQDILWCPACGYSKKGCYT
jgi:rubrerythrin